MDRKGGVEPLKLPPGAYASPRVSPDGTRIAFGTDDGKEAIVWIYDLSGMSAMQRLTFGGNNRFPIWSADGKRVAFQSDRDSDLAIFWQPADGTGTAERLTMNRIQGESHAPSPGLRRATGSCSASRRGPTCRCGRSRSRTGRRRPSARSTRRIPPAPCFRLMDDGWPTRIRNGAGRRSTSSHSQPLGPSISSLQKGSDVPHTTPGGHPMEKSSSTIRGSTASKPSASRRNRRLRSGILWRCRSCSSRGGRHFTPPHPLPRGGGGGAPRRGGGKPPAPSFRLRSSGLH